MLSTRFRERSRQKPSKKKSFESSRSLNVLRKASRFRKNWVTSLTRWMSLRDTLEWFSSTVRMNSWHALIVSEKMRLKLGLKSSSDKIDSMYLTSTFAFSAP